MFILFVKIIIAMRGELIFNLLIFHVFIFFTGGVVNSTVVPQVQAVFPQGALTKKIKVGLQVNMFRPRKNVPNGLLKKITVNHLPKKKRFSLIW